MMNRGFLSVKWLVFLVIFSLSLSTGVSAGQVPDMKGSWDGVSLMQYSGAAGYENRSSSQGPFIITAQEDRAFAGKESYSESQGGEEITETIAAVLSADGTRFWQDHDGRGLSFGEMVSDHEFYNYMLFPDDGPMVIVSHMVRNGTDISADDGEPQNLVGTWNFTQLRRNAESTNSGAFLIESQEGRLWNGRVRFDDEDGTPVDMTVIGAVGTRGDVYAVTENGALCIGNITGEHSVHSVIIHPGDPDGTFVIDRWMSRNDTAIEMPEVAYPDISGDWNISSRLVISNETITGSDAVTDEWMSYTNRSGQFFSSVRHSHEAGMPPELSVSGIFNGPDQAFLADTAPTVVIYHFPDEKTIEAVVIRKEDIPTIFFDKLVKNPGISG